MMQTADQEYLRLKAEVFKALGHPTRLIMIEALGEQGEQCVCELQTLIGADLSTVSKHLTVLRHAGLVSSEKRGKQVYYRLRCPCALDFMSCVERTLAVRGL